MKAVALVQNTAAWLEFRKSHFMASDAPAMMGMSKYKTRDELLHEKSTGETKPVTDFQQSLFDRGHEVEALARPIIEERIGEDLYPVVAVSDDNELIGASFDGITMLEDVIFEHKLWNKKLVEFIEANNDLPDTHWPQVEQQLYVSKADRCTFVVSDGTKDNMFTFEYQSRESRINRILINWKTFADDLDKYEPVEKVVVKATTIDNLPDLFVDITGQVNNSNLVVYRRDAMELINGINTDLKTDQDFADAESMIKFCNKAEKNIAEVKEKAMAGAAEINEVFSALDQIGEAMRSKRLELNKLVKNKKAQIKDDMLKNALTEIESFVSEQEDDLDYALGFDARSFNDSLNSSIKGKRNLDSMSSSINQVVADEKSQLLVHKQQMIFNITELNTHKKYASLFPDASQLVHLMNDEFKRQVELRISAFEEQQEIERKKAEETARIKAENDARIKDEQLAALQAKVTPEPTQKPDISDMTFDLAKPGAERTVKMTINPDITVITLASRTFDNAEKYDYRNRIKITKTVNGCEDVIFSVMDDEPEDSNLSRSFNDCFDVINLMSLAYQAGKSGERWAFQTVDLDD